MAEPDPAAAPRDDDGQPKRRRHADRWGGDEILLKPGYVAVPVLFLRHYARLKPFPLTPSEAMFVLHLMEFKWDAEKPFPGYELLAKRMGVTPRAVRRHAKSLETKQLLVRHARTGQTNLFDLSQLFERLREIAVQEAANPPRRGRAEAPPEADPPVI